MIDWNMALDALMLTTGLVGGLWVWNDILVKTEPGGDQ